MTLSRDEQRQACREAIAASVAHERSRWREWFEAIAADDELVEANPEAFAIHALRRRQKQARLAIEAMESEA